MEWGGVMWICPGDEVVVFLRGFKGIVGVKGKVVGFGEGGFVVHDGNAEYFIRGSEVRLIKKRVATRRGEFSFVASDTNTEVFCRGVAYAYAYVYYREVEGRLVPVSRRELRLPMLRPCYPQGSEGCVVWRRAARGYRAYVFERHRYHRTRYTLPPGVVPRVRRVAYMSWDARPTCFTVVNGQRESVEWLAFDVNATVRYEKRRKDKGPHNFYLECHCNSEYTVASYSTVRELYEDFANDVDGCITCVNDYIEGTIGFDAFDAMGGRVDVDYLILSKPPRSGCAFAHRESDLLAELRTHGFRYQGCSP